MPSRKAPRPSRRTKRRREARRSRPSRGQRQAGKPPRDLDVRRRDRGRARGARGAAERGRSGTSAGRELKLTNLDKALFAPLEGTGEQPITKRELIAYFGRIAPAMLPHLAERPLNLQRFPNGAGSPGLLAEGHPLDARPTGCAAGRRSASTIARRTPTSSPTASPSCAGSATRPRSRSTPGPAARAAGPADVRPRRHRPRREDDVGRDARARPALPGRVRASRAAGLPEGDRQARHPGLAADRAEVRVPRDERLGREALAGDRGDGPEPRLVGVGEGGPQGPGPARLHPEHVHQDARRAVRRPAGAGRAGVGADHAGTSWTTRRCGRTRSRSGTSSSASPSVGDLFAGAQTDLQELPKLG